MDIASVLGMSVEAARHSLSREEFLDWKAMYSIRPYGISGEEIRWGRLMCMMHKAHLIGPIPSDGYVSSVSRIRELTDGDEDEDMAGRSMRSAMRKRFNHVKTHHYGQ